MKQGLKKYGASIQKGEKERLTLLFCFPIEGNLATNHIRRLK